MLLSSRVPAARLRVASRVAAVIAVVFGVMTITAGASVVFDLGQARADHPHYVPFVLWFNMLSGVLYGVAGVGLWLQRRWAAWVAFALVIGLLLVGAGFGVHVASGGAYDRSTVSAMALRLAVWIAIASFSWVALARLPGGRARRARALRT